jgi:hypothetical protein
LRGRGLCAERERARHGQAEQVKFSNESHGIPPVFVRALTWRVRPGRGAVLSAA